MPITYPVDSSSRFVVYAKSDNSIVRKGIRWPREDGQPLVDPDPAFGIAIIVVAPQPAYDPSTHKLQRVDTLVTSPTDEYQVTWSVIPLTPAELAAIAEAAAKAAQRQALRDAVATLRSWADDAEGTTVTTGNAVNVLQTVVDRLGVFFDRFADLIEADPSLMEVP